MKFSLTTLKSFDCKNVGHLHVKTDDSDARSVFLFGIHKVVIDVDFEPNYWQKSVQAPLVFDSKNNTDIDIVWNYPNGSQTIHTIAYAGSEFFIEPKEKEAT